MNDLSEFRFPEMLHTVESQPLPLVPYTATIQTKPRIVGKDAFRKYRPLLLLLLKVALFF